MLTESLLRILIRTVDNCGLCKCDICKNTVLSVEVHGNLSYQSKKRLQRLTTHKHCLSKLPKVDLANPGVLYTPVKVLTFQKKNSSLKQVANMLERQRNYKCIGTVSSFLYIIFFFTHNAFTQCYDFSSSF